MTSTRRRPRKKVALSPHDWVKAGFQLLTAKGASALKAEVIARRLKTTKGSFYWHFKDVPAFHAAMLEIWEDEATRDIMRQVDASAASAVQRLALLSEIVAHANAKNDYGGLEAEPAIRQWAKTEPAAAGAVVRVDRLRIDYVSSLFAGVSASAGHARAKAEIFYGTFVGLQALAGSQNIDIGERMRQLLQLQLKV